MLRPIETKEYKQKHDIRKDDFFRMIIHVLDPHVLEKYFVKDGTFTFEKILSTYGNEPRFQGKNTIKYNLKSRRKLNLRFQNLVFTRVHGISSTILELRRVSFITLPKNAVNP